MTTECFEIAARKFDEAHQHDPKTITVGGATLPWSVHYHARLTAWVRALMPDAPEAMLLAARCQHLRRWEKPRSDFPTGTAGYKRWRSQLAQFHAQAAADILASAGYTPAVIHRVRDFLIKKGLKRDAQMQVFEDAICLVFLENQFTDFVHAHTEEKLTDILQKTWAKMSPTGHEHALGLIATLPKSIQTLVQRALGATHPN